MDYANQVSHDSYFVEFTPTNMNEMKIAYVDSNKNSMLVKHEKNALCDSYIVEFLHDATKNFYERWRYAFIYFNNINFPLFMMKVLKSWLFCLPMLVDSRYNKSFAYKIPMHRKCVKLKCFFYMIHDTLLYVSIPILMWASLKSSCLAKRL